ncbi:McrC family protein [Janthinobacterium sp. B9-8]|uniref:McrC family protein n=1 Tax=Janthinobacterium sp. B9-8 TaxID=1236179 RepID=UPI00061CE53B|nr:McrC family protein [Janthinobacterium sp. B9-8]AMC35576.1 restriction endonuclease [Janthinobacterium sp. B9-8]
MLAPIVVREYARLTTSPLPHPTLDEAQISKTAFGWLCELAGRFRSSGASLLQVDGRRRLKLDNFVGVLESPCGQVIEILPKHRTDDDCVVEARGLMRKLISSALQMSARHTEVASLELYDAPLAEWVMQQFLFELDHLIKRGLRFDYLRVEEEQRYLRGQLDVVKQMRQPPGRQHFFQIRHDIFLPDRPENRLLKSALELVCRNTQDAENWRLAHELAGMLHELPPSRDIEQDFRLWRNDRLMAHYQGIKSWCELILHQQMPLAVAGEYRGISLLFPMEKLFESYVEQQLRMLLPLGALRSQVQSEYLCSHKGERIFRLKPDLLLNLHGQPQIILDTKWKLLDAADRSNNYGLSQSDFYQLFAYGQKYLKGSGELVLIYPAWPKFNCTKPIADFHFDEKLSLRVLPFDLEDSCAAQNLIDQLSMPVQDVLVSAA